ncbi:MAG: Rpn family recombination-promoting nuclease/putative transposase [Cyanobacteriota bacterium]
MPFDNTCKYLSETYPDSFVNWLFGTAPESIEVLKTELSLEPIRADFVAHLPEEQRLLHIEFQVKGETDPPLSLRMLDYWVRLHRSYRLPVTQFLVMLKYSSAAAEVEDEFFLEQTRHRYNVVRLWEQDPEPLLQDTALLPMAVLCAAENSEQLLGRVAEEVGKIEVPEQRQVISNCTQLLAGLRFSKDLIRQLFSGGIMRESVIYQEILEEGREEGKREEALGYTMRLLRRWLGTVEPELEAQIRELTKQELEDLGEALLDFSEPADLTAWLESCQDSRQD